jgi:hypothetical protein
MGGVRTRLVLAPEQGVAVVVLCNAASELTARFTQELLASQIPVYAERLATVTPATPSSTTGETPPKSPFAPPEELLGRWTGRVLTYQRELPLELIVQESGDVHVRLAGGLWTLLNEPRFENGFLLGVFAGDIATADANRRPYHLHLNVRPRGEALNGSLTAISLPAPRLGNALSYWVDLRKAP